MQSSSRVTQKAARPTSPFSLLYPDFLSHDKDSDNLLRPRVSALVLALLICGSLVFSQAPANQPTAPDPQQVLSYLNQTIDWYRHLAVEEQLDTDAVDTLYLNDHRQVGLQVMRLSFDFARSAGQQQPAAAADAQKPANSRYQTLAQAASKAEAEIRDTQTEIVSVQDKLRNARSAAARKQLEATVDELQSELELARARSETIRNILQFASTGAGTGSNSLLAEVEELQRTVPEAAPSAPANTPSSDAQSKSTTTPAPAQQDSASRAQPSGILALITNLFALSRKMRTIDQSIDLTNALSASSKSLRAPVVKSLTAAVQRGNELAKQADVSDPAALQQEKRELDALTTQFKQVSSLALPLSKQSILLDLYKSSLQRWRGSVKTEYTTELKSLAVRLAVLAFVLLALFVLSEVWRRATFRYVHDFRRRYQFLLLRRILMWFAVAIVLAFALATEIGSLATFAGLITAGVAVALQNVILAVAGYFFLIGKYGVRVGDRVQISGITGDVMEIGLVRLHLVELGGSGHYLQPTGRVVVFSNSIVFQPTASFFKQIPGTNFVWHEVRLTLAPESDFQVAETRLLGAVEKVYGEYKDKIEQEHRHMEQTLNIPIALPKPQSSLHLTQAGLEVVIRYPLDMQNATGVDDRITRELLKAVRQSPRLKVLGAETLDIKPVPDAKPAEE